MPAYLWTNKRVEDHLIDIKILLMGILVQLMAVLVLLVLR